MSSSSAGILQWFCFDNTQAVHLATQHLVELGHKRIGYIGASPALLAGQDRLDGFRAAQKGASIDDKLVECGPGSNPEFGREALRRLMALKRPPTGLVLGSLQHTRGDALGHRARALWSWDMTYLPAVATGRWFYLYLILDVFSRKIVGFEVHAKDSADHAAHLVKRTALAEGIHAMVNKPVLHGDNGATFSLHVGLRRHR